MKTRVLSIAIMLGYALLGYGQDNGVKPSADLPKLVPPSPTAFEMTKYGEFPVGLYTGTPMVNVPITVYGTKNIQVPISLDYSSNGIKVDQMSSNVGLGWSLTVGGVISRIVKGKEDENYRITHPIREISKADLSKVSSLSAQPKPLEFVDVDPDIVEFLHRASKGNNEVIDTETDLFSYNILGQSGKIVMDNEGVYRTVPHTALKVERENTASQSFILTTSNGVKYYFSDIERTHSRNRCNNNFDTSPEAGYISAWYLSKIVHPKGDEVYFSYVKNSGVNVTDYQFTTGYSQSLKISSSYPSINPNFPSTKGITTCESVQRIESKRLLEITSNSTKAGKIKFMHAFDHPSGVHNYKLVSGIQQEFPDGGIKEQVNLNYLFTANKRAFLTGVTYKDPSKKYVFEYNTPEGLPKRFAIAQDYWGYFNNARTGNLANYDVMLPDLGSASALFKIHTNRLLNRKPNSVFSQYGLLNKVVFPTKGFTTFEYEGNEFWGTENGVFYETYSLEKIGARVNRMAEFTIGNYNVNQKVEVTLNGIVTGYVNESEGCYDYPFDKAAATIQIFDVTNGQNTLVYQDTYTKLNKLAKSILLAHSRSYRAVIIAGGKPTDCIQSNATIRVKKITSTPKSIATGGNRVTRIKSYAAADHSQPAFQKRYYYYNSWMDPKSSGAAVEVGTSHIQSNIEYQLVNLGNAKQLQSQRYKTLSTSGRIPLTNSGSNNIYYRKVFVSHGGDNYELGGEEHEFYINRNEQGEVILGKEKDYIALSNYGWNHGKEKSVKFFKKPSSLLAKPTYVKEQFNTYKLAKTVGEINNYDVSQNYNIVIPITTNPTYKCKVEDLSKRRPVYQCQLNHRHYISDGFNGGTYVPSDANGKGPRTLGHNRCRIFMDRNIIVDYINHKCYGKSEGEIVGNAGVIRNLNVYKYKTFSYWSYQSEKEEKIYDINGQNPVTTTTKYFYDNDLHLQLTRTEVVNSKGQVQLTKMYYPDDVNSVNSLHHDPLSVDEKTVIDQLKTDKLFRINEPVQVEVYNNGNLQSTVRNHFKEFSGMILPKNVELAKGNQGLEKRVIYHSYDSKGNPKEVSKQDGTRITYLWGYDYNHPIAKIENASYAQVMIALGKQSTDNLEYLQTMNEAALQVVMTKLRANLPTAQVSSYTYIPLVGVSTITDPRGQKMTYHYDAYNRLQYVKDSQGNILKEHKYNYKN